MTSVYTNIQSLVRIVYRARKGKHTQANYQYAHHSMHDFEPFDSIWKQCLLKFWTMEIASHIVHIKCTLYCLEKQSWVLSVCCLRFVLLLNNILKKSSYFLNKWYTSKCNLLSIRLECTLLKTSLCQGENLTYLKVPNTFVIKSLKWHTRKFCDGEW